MNFQYNSNCTSMIVSNNKNKSWFKTINCYILTP
jgi:hypothetical protein